MTGKTDIINEALLQKLSSQIETVTISGNI